MIKKKQEAKTKSVENYRSELEENAKKGSSRPLLHTVKKFTKPFHSHTG
jgi:hypothetical protein